MTDITESTLIALAEACEGRLQLDCHGIRQVTTDDELSITIEMEDGRRLTADEADEAQLNLAIQHWREQHPAFFQRILGAMM